VLGDRTAPEPQRVEALKFIVHFIGDMHQPLHASDNHDRGGNQVQVVFHSRHTNLHSLWDNDFVRLNDPAPESLARTLLAGITPADADVWSKGTVNDWA